MLYNNYIKKTFLSNNHKASARGVVLITTLIITLLLAIIATTILAIGLWSYEQATFYEDYNQALYSAEAGINYAISANTAGWGNVGCSSTGNLFNASFYVSSSTMAADTIRIVSTATVNRLTYRVRAVSVDVIDRDPWKHFIWQGCSGAPAGKDPTEYPTGYNSTSNGPQYGTGEIGILTYGNSTVAGGGKKWEPYWSKITAKIAPNAVYIGADTTIVNYTTSASGLVNQQVGTGNSSAVVYGLHVTPNGGSSYNVYGSYTGMLYLQGTINVTGNLFVYGQVYAVGGNLNIAKNITLTVMQVTTCSPASSSVAPQDKAGDLYKKYITIAAIDTSASQTCASPLNSNAGNIVQSTGNSTLHMGSLSPCYWGGVLFCSNADLKNGQGTIINGVLMIMDNDINGFPSGDYYYDPTVSQNAPILGISVDNITGKKVLPGTWRELPSDWSL